MCGQVLISMQCTMIINFLCLLFYSREPLIFSNKVLVIRRLKKAKQNIQRSFVIVKWWIHTWISFCLFTRLQSCKKHNHNNNKLLSNWIHSNSTVPMNVHSKQIKQHCITSLLLFSMSLSYNNKFIIKTNLHIESCQKKPYKNKWIYSKIRSGVVYFNKNHLIVNK